MFEILSQKLSSIFSKLRGQTKITDSSIEETLISLQESLIEADVPYDIVKNFTQELKEEIIGKKLIKGLKPDEQLMKLVHEKVLKFLKIGSEKLDLKNNLNFDKYSNIVVMGLKGSGKTTTLAKMANYIKQTNNNYKTLLTSLDFHRPAAIDQLENLAQKNNLNFYRTNAKNIREAAQEIENYKKEHNYEILLVDTAGKSQSSAAISELQEIDYILKPKYKFLVLDTMTGQNALKVAQEFLKEVGYSGTILTKMDSESRSGAALALGYATQKPIVFLANGEKIDDIELFRPERVAKRILDMGDIATLIEKAEAKIKKDEQKNWQKKIEKGKINLQDFADQMSMVSRIGSLSSIIKYLPGAGSLNISKEQLENGENEIKKFKVIINSMTRKERFMPEIINKSRKLRITKGSGTEVSELNELLAKFKQTQKAMIFFKKMGKY